MATTVIHDACEAGALSGLLSGRDQTLATAAGYVTLVGIAKAIADQFIVFNAASSAAIADADKVSIGPVVSAITQGIVDGRNPTSTLAADYANYASDIYYIAKEAIAVGGLT